MSNKVQMDKAWKQAVGHGNRDSPTWGTVSLGK